MLRKRKWLWEEEEEGKETDGTLVKMNFRYNNGGLSHTEILESHSLLIAKKGEGRAPRCAKSVSDRNFRFSSRRPLGSRMKEAEKKRQEKGHCFS